MKTHLILIFAALLGTTFPLIAEEKLWWTPDIGYNTDRRLDPSDPDSPMWNFTIDARRAEYRMLYLLQAHKDAVLLLASLEGKVAGGNISQDQIVMLRGIAGNLDDVVRCSYVDVVPYFAIKKNPTLLLMMLYHFEVYCNGGGSSESWPGSIKPIQQIDPALTAKAKDWAKKGNADLKATAEQAGADQPATKPADKPPVKDQPSTPTPKVAPR